MEPLRLLVADDHEIVRRGLRTLIEAQPGWQVTAEASDGREAVEKAKAIKPDVTVLDIGMPVLDGFGVVRKLRENPHFTSLPIVAVTAYAMQGDREEILNSGFDGYLSKPITNASLVQELDRLLARPTRQSVSPTQSCEQPQGKRAARAK